MSDGVIAPNHERLRLRLALRGAVQGVGFRPFVFRLAAELSLTGWVNNSPQGVAVEVEGPRSALEQFLLRLEKEKPPRSSIQSLEASWLDPLGRTGFEIRESGVAGEKTALVLPDIATCPDCLREIFDPTNRRFRYPFTNCTNCGPRFSIIKALPYDRANTSMKSFKLCPACQAEYDDPRDRRFHAQPNACPVCGPRLELWVAAQARTQANVEAEAGDRRDARPAGNEALVAAAQAIRRGEIVAVKGLGGFHLMVDSRSEEAVQRLRERKHREEKPLALMFPAIESVNALCEVSPLEERLLRSPEAPIVLLKRLDRSSHEPRGRVHSVRAGTGLADPRRARSDAPYQRSRFVTPLPAPADCSSNEVQREATSDGTLSLGEKVGVRAGEEKTASPIASSIAPGNPNLGVMLPSNPLHHLLVAELGFPVVATSGNLSDEPICTNEQEALERLRGIADVFLVHNRPIVRHVDDSIVQVVMNREMVLRRARGYAPLPIQVRSAECGARNILAVGAHLKNSVALTVGSQVFVSQHLGDLETEQAHTAFRRVIADFQTLFDTKPDLIAADLHPDYLSTRFAQSLTQVSPPAGLGDIPAARANSARGHAGNSQAGSLRYVGVQHHIAHVLSCMAENDLQPPVLGVAWDGTGYGLDGTIWGGEFFLVTDESVERIAHLRPFRLPGGDAATKEPRRAALGLLRELRHCDPQTLSHMQQSLGKTFSAKELALLESMLQQKVNCPQTSSVGRLFDSVASLTGLRQLTHFEGQAAMELEFALEGVGTDEMYPINLLHRDRNLSDTGATPALLDWSPMIEGIIADVKDGASVGEISTRFHNALAEAVVAVAGWMGQPRVVLSGGCFQNRYLTERTVKRLRAAGFQPYWHQRVPPNDGGICLGQIVAARRANR